MWVGLIRMSSRVVILVFYESGTFYIYLVLYKALYIYLFCFQDKDAPELQAREIYAPLTKGGGEPFSAPTARTPLPNKKYRLCETPYLQSLQLVLDRALNRPITYYNQERHLLMNMCIERNLLPSVAVEWIFLFAWYKRNKLQAIMS